MACVSVPVAADAALTAGDIGTAAAIDAGTGAAIDAGTGAALDGVAGLGSDVAGGALAGGAIDAGTGALVGDGLTGAGIGAAGSGISDFASGLGLTGDTFGTGANSGSVLSSLASPAAATASPTDPAIFSSAYNSVYGNPANLISAAAGAPAAAGAAAPTTGASILGTIAKLAPLITTAMGGTKYPGTISQKQVQAQQAALQANQQQLNQGFEKALNAGSTNGPLRTQTNPNVNYATYGAGPQQSFFNNINPITQFPDVTTAPVQNLKKGGMPIDKREISHYSYGSRPAAPKINPNTHGAGGQDDTVPTNLSQGEFVVPADVTASLGDGNTKAGGGALQTMVKQVRKHKTSKGTALPPPAKSPLQYMASGGVVGLPRPSSVNLGRHNGYVGA